MGVAIPTAPALSRWRDPRRAALITASAGATALVTTAAVLGAMVPGPDADPDATALLRGSLVAAPLGVGLYASATRQYTRFARLLLIIGLTAFVTTLAESSDATLYTLGRTAGWLLEALVVVALLAFPSGRLTDAADRRLAGAMCAVVAIADLPTLVFADALKVPSPYTSCISDCPGSILMAFERQPAFVEPAFFAAGSFLVFCLMVAVLVQLQRHLGRASPLLRRMLVPVLAVGMVRVAAVGIAVVAREIDPDDTLAGAGAATIAWCTPLLAIAFLVGLLRLRLSWDRALRQLASCAGRMPDVPTLQRAFADTFDDADLRITLTSADAGRGDPETAAGGRADRRTIPVHDHHGVEVATIDYDTSLAECRELVETAGTIAAVALANLRLTEEADAAAAEVLRSRARIAATADRERRRIERDLHDGAQQQLVAIRIELGLAEDLARTDPRQCAARIHQLENALDDALEELRSLAHGICPPLLADQGLQEAVRAVAARCSVPTALEVDGVVRYTPEVESAVYFCVLEALQNVAKHAPEARRVVVRLDAGVDDQLRFSVRDDGAATGRPEPRGAGITNMQDRASAVGGELYVICRRGIGTEVRGRVPARRDRPAGGQRS
ncbi:hypothetical protein DSM104299_01791 [Baekduia alba]|uniref:sensor histidine kinase n=1 Tax=Baekduia alba TaxID=2997333 RepID=UPI00234103ED|nr:histidine kinase [Baekduia alba]WCB93089.1 hypothetical protein DSM104299_01791 [Baekduia alba]